MAHGTSTAVAIAQHHATAPQIVAERSAAVAIREIREGTSEHVQLLDIIDTLPTYMGVRHALAEEQVTTAYVFIRDHFAHLNPVEIVRAFSMAAAGSLTIMEGGKEVTVQAETYQSFSLPYVGRILRAYSEKRERDFVRHRAECERAQRLLAEADRPEMSAEDVLAYIDDFTARTLEVPAFCHWEKAYMLLAKRGDICMSDEEKKAYRAEVVRSIMDAARQNGRLRETRSTLTESSIRSECRKRLVITWAIAKYPGAKYPLPIHLPKVQLKPSKKAKK